MDEDPSRIDANTLIGAGWRNIVTWPNPVTGSVSSSASSNIYFQDCPCDACKRVKQQLTPETLYRHVASQELRIVKLEELVKMLTKALGVNEEFLSEAYKK